MKHQYFISYFVQQNNVEQSYRIHLWKIVEFDLEKDLKQQIIEEEKKMKEPYKTHNANLVILSINKL